MIESMKRRIRVIAVPRLIAMVGLVLVFGLILIAPLASLFSKAFVTKTGEWAGLGNYAKYFGTPSLSASIWNTIDISLWSTVFSVAIGFMMAYALTRTRIVGKTVFRYAAMAPIFVPTLVHALALVYLFGKQGVITRLGLDIGLYGRTGIIISETIFTFPQAFLMFLVALEYADGRLYETADSIGVSPLRQFFRITLPDVKYTVINASFVCFTLAFTDFGAPKVLGGSYNVLATDIYKQIAGQFNMNMGSVVGTLLLIPAVLSFLVGRIVNSQNASTLSAKAIQLRPQRSMRRDSIFFALCSLVTLGLIAMFAALFMGALTRYYPYDMGLTLRNFEFDASTGGIESFYHSIEMSIWTAVIGTVFVFTYAYMMEKTRGFSLLKKFGNLLSVLPIALPGMVIGLAFIFFFNNRSNPLHFIYGTIVILVLSNILHYFSVPFITATSALKKLDGEFESVAESMSVSGWRTVVRVSVPLSMPAILEIFMYFFVNSMVTVSAVVFLYSPQFRVASIAITHMEEAGNFNQAAAMSLLILMINVSVRILYEMATKIIRKRMVRRETARA